MPLLGLRDTTVADEEAGWRAAAEDDPACCVRLSTAITSPEPAAAGWEGRTTPADAPCAPLSLTGHGADTTGGCATAEGAEAPASGPRKFAAGQLTFGGDSKLPLPWTPPACARPCSRPEGAGFSVTGAEGGAANRLPNAVCTASTHNARPMPYLSSVDRRDGGPPAERGRRLPEGIVGCATGLFPSQYADKRRCADRCCLTRFVRVTVHKRLRKRAREGETIVSFPLIKVQSIKACSLSSSSAAAAVTSSSTTPGSAGAASHFCFL